MKELSIEEKAKAYEEALERAKAFKSPYCQHAAEVIFPELKENEDEMIRKELIKEINGLWENDSATWPSSLEKKNKYIAWLEKQGEQEEIDYNEELKKCKANPLYFFDKYVKIKLKEQKSANKVEPKFKVGDWVVFKNRHQSIYQVEKIEGGYYILRHTHGGTFRVCILHDEDLRHWSIIVDARDGDVLTCHTIVHGNNMTQTGIVKQYIGRKGGWLQNFTCYVFNDWDDNLRFDDYMGSGMITPATKKQRDTLMKAMADAGWEFDFEKKELKKIEHKPANKVEPKFKVGDWVVDQTFAIEDYTGAVGQVEEVIYLEGRTHPYYIIADHSANYKTYLQGKKPISEYYLRLWDIEKDAKDGDVLSDEKPFIFRGFGDKEHPNNPTAYCGICTSGKFILSTENEWWTGDDVYPATKKQRDLLFSKMKEAGYTFDFNKKELKKIEQKPVYHKFRVGDEIKTINEEPITITKIDDKGYWSNDLFICNFDDEVCWDMVEQKPITPKFKVGDTIKCTYDNRQFTIKSVDIEKGVYTYTEDGCSNDIDYADEYFELVEQKPAWSEEDEYQINTILHGLDLKKELYKKEGNQAEEKRYKTQYDWLKALKYRMQPQQKQEWGKEDSERILRIHQFIWANRKGDTDEIYQLEQDADWLMTLNPQKKQEWSKEDERNLQGIIDEIKANKHKEHHAATFEIEECIELLKSLKSKNQYDKGYNDGYSAAKYNRWKPSREQMKALNWIAYNYLLMDKETEENLQSLYNDLKTFES